MDKRNWRKCRTDETIVEIATDKVDSEVPSTHEGKLVEKLFEADDLVQVGQAFAILETDGDDGATESIETVDETPALLLKKPCPCFEETPKTEEKVAPISNTGDRFYSPLVRNMAAKENIGIEELNTIPGTGKDGRVSKADMVSYLKNRTGAPKAEAPKPVATPQETQPVEEVKTEAPKAEKPKPASTPIANTGDVEILKWIDEKTYFSSYDHV